MKLPKCRDCKWLTGEITSVGIGCTNPEKQNRWRNDIAHLKHRSDPACIYFELGENNSEERWTQYQLEKKKKLYKKSESEE